MDESMSVWLICAHKLVKDELVVVFTTLFDHVLLIKEDKDTSFYFFLL